MSTVVELKTGLASEGGHWYTQQGEPAYEVPKAKGDGMRPVTLRDARKLGLYPSVTGIIREAAAHGLERWKQDQLLLAAATLPKREEESVDDWLVRVRQDGQAQADTARDLGTEIHRLIELALRGEPEDSPYAHLVQPVVDLIESRWPGHSAWIERSFAHKSGFGGRIDLAIMTQDGQPVALVDFKTTDKPLESVKAWPSHAMQLAAQAQGLFDSLAVPCLNVFVSTREPGIHIWQHPAEDIRIGWSKFQCLLEYWKWSRGYFPGGINDSILVDEGPDSEADRL